MKLAESPKSIQVPYKLLEAEASEREWLVTNGLGGYSSGTVSGVMTRKYHGLLVGVVPGSYGRTMFLNCLHEMVTIPGNDPVMLSSEEKAEECVDMITSPNLRHFGLDMGIPVWNYSFDEANLEKRLIMRYRQNTVQVKYRLLGSVPIRLDLKPCVRFQPHNIELGEAPHREYDLSIKDDMVEIVSGDGYPPLLLDLREGTGRPGAHTFISRPQLMNGYTCRVEKSRGYPFKLELYSPGFFSLEIPPGGSVYLVASVEPRESLTAVNPIDALEMEQTRRRYLLDFADRRLRSKIAFSLVLAADQFIIVPAVRKQDIVRINSRGGEIRSVIAGYHWFTDWGRDTMISLEGLTLLTGREREAMWILRTFAHYIHNGLIPNVFPEGEREARYNTADATLWFFHALSMYLEYTGDRTTLRILLPQLLSIIKHHERGTDFGIHVDDDGLLAHGNKDLPLTWMDAKVGDWVVTPRNGKAVEINALWYNALMLLEEWLRIEDRLEEADRISRMAIKARTSFNRKFWYEEGGYLYDVIDGDEGNDFSLRPNQIFALSLTNPVLDRSRWSRVLSVVQENLMTPVGLRTLSPDDPNYKAQYFGDLRSRDAAYHQGTVWPWLTGAFIDAYLRVYPGDKRGGRTYLDEMIPYLDRGGIGTVCEIFDAESPFLPRGCVSQAWSVAELLRSRVKTSVRFL